MEKTQINIMIRAKDIFFKEGFSKITMEELASRLKISKRTLYKYFANKMALLDAIIDQKMNELNNKLTTLFTDPSSDFVQKLMGIFSIVGNELALISGNLLKDVYYNAPGIWEKIEKIRREYIFNRIENFINQGVDQGVIRDDIKIQLIFPLFFNTIQNIMKPEQLRHLSFPPSEVFESVFQIIYGGILTDSARDNFLTSYKNYKTKKEQAK